MKSLENKTTTIRLTADKHATYGDIIKGAIEGVPAQGVSVGEMRSAINVIGAIDSANGTIELEEADFNFMRQRLNDNKWAIVHKDILQLVDDINSVE